MSKKASKQASVSAEHGDMRPKYDFASIISITRGIRLPKSWQDVSKAQVESRLRKSPRLFEKILLPA